jgi:hypothetical protein
MTERRRNQTPDDHDVVLLVVRSSGLYWMLSEMLAGVQRAAQTSACAAAARGVYGRWRTAPASQRVRAVAIMLATAAFVYLAANRLLGNTVGQFWVAIPVAVLIASAMLFVTSRDAGAAGKAL